MRLAASEESLEEMAEAFVDLQEGGGELLVRHHIGVCYEPLDLGGARAHIVELFSEE